MPATDEDAALLAIDTLDPLSKEQIDAKDKIDALLVTEDPFIDIHELFALYNTLYFRSLLFPRVEVLWSARLTLCAGICELVRDPGNKNKYTKIRLKLSEPLLKFRPRSDVVNTLLHEAMHAYFFITTSWRHSRGDDGTGHGAGFLLLADAINSHGAEHGYEITVYHTFHDEVDSYRTHIWQCNGPCKSQPPFFGLVKRAMNRPPGRNDTWWKRHEEECGGSFTKVAEPEASKAKVEKMTGLERAGRQKNKIDGFFSSKQSRVCREHADVEDAARGEGVKRLRSPTPEDGNAKRLRETVSCPICSKEVAVDAINDHLDALHPY